MELGIQTFPSSSSNPSAIDISEAGYVFGIEVGVWGQWARMQTVCRCLYTCCLGGVFDK